MAAAQFVEVPNYAALILRRTYADLSQAGALLDKSKEWWKGTAARWSDKEKMWRFPSGASVSFGYLEHEDDKYRYASSEYSFVAFDELTQFSDTQYAFLSTRLRRLASSWVPLRKRAATNPIGPGKEWVKKRFIPQEYLDSPEEEQFSRVWIKDGRAFVPAKLEDNPSLDIPSYEKSLAVLDPVVRRQMRHGDWKAHAEGRFDRRWWKRYTDLGDAYRLDDTGEVLRKEHFQTVCTMDPASTKKKTSKYTAIGVGSSAPRGQLLIKDVVRKQLAVPEIVPALAHICRWHHPVDWVGIEATGFQIALVEEARDHSRYPAIPVVHEFQPEGKSKLTRATPAILKAEGGGIYLPHEADWLEDFEAELSSFTGDEKEDTYTDQVDMLAYMVLGLNRFAGNAEEPFAGRSRAW